MKETLVHDHCYTDSNDHFLHAKLAIPISDHGAPRRRARAGIYMPPRPATRAGRHGPRSGSRVLRVKSGRLSRCNNDHARGFLSSGGAFVLCVCLSRARCCCSYPNTPLHTGRSYVAYPGRSMRSHPPVPRGDARTREPAAFVRIGEEHENRRGDHTDTPPPAWACVGVPAHACTRLFIRGRLALLLSKSRSIRLIMRPALKSYRSTQSSQRSRREAAVLLKVSTARQRQLDLASARRGGVRATRHGAMRLDIGAVGRAVA